MKTLRINEEKLKTVVLEAVKEMINFEWSGWKIDVLATEEGEIFCSSKNTNNYYRNATVLFSVESVVYNKEEWSSENDCAYESMLWYIDNFNEMLIDCDLEIILES